MQRVKPIRPRQRSSILEVFSQKDTAQCSIARFSNISVFVAAACRLARLRLNLDYEAAPFTEIEDQMIARIPQTTAALISSGQKLDGDSQRLLALITESVLSANDPKNSGKSSLIDE